MVPGHRARVPVSEPDTQTELWPLCICVQLVQQQLPCAAITQVSMQYPALLTRGIIPIFATSPALVLLLFCVSDRVCICPS